MWFREAFIIKPISFLGPKGTYTHEAASKVGNNLIPYCTIPAVFESVDEGECVSGVIPIENSIEGAVGQTLDIFAHKSNLKISGEIIIPIDHCLIVNKGSSLEDITDVYSHSQALGQCRDFLSGISAQLHYSVSTANAAKSIIGNFNSGAIGNSKSAELYDLDIIARGIQDVDNNETRFVIISKDDSLPSNNDKTSIIFSLFEDNPGELYKILGIFLKENINLTKIESRPSKKGLGDYLFYVDFHGHRKDPVISDILEKINKNTSFLKIIGSYPEFNESSID